jgi:hypothetical protein
MGVGGSQAGPDICPQAFVDLSRMRMIIVRPRGAAADAQRDALASVSRELHVPCIFAENADAGDGTALALPGGVGIDVMLDRAGEVQGWIGDLIRGNRRAGGMIIAPCMSFALVLDALAEDLKGRGVGEVVQGSGLAVLYPAIGVVTTSSPLLDFDKEALGNAMRDVVTLAFGAASSR